MATTEPKITHEGVARTFAGYPPAVRRKLLMLRRLIFDTAAATQGVGAIEEALKWGEPAYLTAESRSGSTIRLAWKEANPTQYRMNVHCQTDLVETFRTLFPETFRFEGNRSILFELNDPVPTEALSICIEAALTYHLRKKKR